MRRRGEHDWTVNANIDRVDHPAPGARGGLPGSAGGFTDLATGEDLPRKQLVRLTAESRVELRFPGGGGYGDPRTRPAQRVLDDVVDGYIGIEAARELYGVDIEYIGDPDALVRPPSAYRIRESGPQSSTRARGRGDV